MSKDISNLSLVCNVYPVKVKNNQIDWDQNIKFIARITDREALGKLIEMKCPGLRDDDQRKAHAAKIPGLSKWQIEWMTFPESCYACDKGDKPWKLVIVNGESISIYKCRKQSCPNKPYHLQD